LTTENELRYCYCLSGNTSSAGFCQNQCEVKPWFLPDSPSFAIVPEPTPLPSESIFDKTTMSAFEGTPLDIALRDGGVTAIAIVGMVMEIAIERTARHAADRGLVPIIIIADARGWGNHDAASGHSTAWLSPAMR
jgi:biuret amidohydrolase